MTCIAVSCLLYGDASHGDHKVNLLRLLGTANSSCNRLGRYMASHGVSLISFCSATVRKESSTDELFVTRVRELPLRCTLITVTLQSEFIILMSLMLFSGMTSSTSRPFSSLPRVTSIRPFFAIEGPLLKLRYCEPDSFVEISIRASLSKRISSLFREASVFRDISWLFGNIFILSRRSVGPG